MFHIIIDIVKKLRLGTLSSTDYCFAIIQRHTIGITPDTAGGIYYRSGSW